MLRSRRTIPVIQHLPSQNGIEDESRHEPIQNEFIVHLLQRGEDAAQAAGEVVEDGECAELTGAALLVDGDDLGELGGDAENAGKGLEGCHQGCRDEGVGDNEGVDGCRDECDKRACQPGLI